MQDNFSGETQKPCCPDSVAKKKGRSIQGKRGRDAFAAEVKKRTAP